jgi:dipeptidyl aminopeptidase/acylaminoacyl peptidase
MFVGAALVACVATLSAVAEKAEATFPGHNGRIAFVSERTTGESVDNSEGDAEIFAINPDGTGLAQLTHNTDNDYDPAWSPDGTRVAYLKSNTRSGSGYGLELYTVSASGEGTPVRLTHVFSHNKASPSWSEDGDEIFYTSETYDSRTGSSTYEVYAVPAGGGEPVLRPGIFAREPQNVPPYYEGGILENDWSWSPDRSSVAYTAIDDDNFQLDQGYTNEIFVRPAGTDASAGVQVTDNPDNVYFRHNVGPAWSPDGSEIAFVGMRDDGNDNDVYVMSASGGAPVQVPNSQASEWSTVDWAPDASPTVTRPSPAPGSGVRDRTPTIAATVRDETTELAGPDLELYVDGARRSFSYNADTDRLSRTTGRLSYGKHRVRIEATDAMGNEAERAWSFRVVRGR